MGFIGKIYAYVDGASRGNPGPSGIGVVIYDENGNKIDEISKFLGGKSKTNQEAEYCAVIEGLSKGAGHCTKKIVIQSDSQLVINQLNREFRIKKEHLLKLHTEVRGLERIYEEVDYVKCTNTNKRIKEADKLAKKAIDDHS